VTGGARHDRPGARRPPGDCIAALLDPPDRLAVRTRLAVLPSLLGVTVDALGGRDFGVAPDLRRAIRARFRGADLAALRPMVGPSTVILPASLVDLRSESRDVTRSFTAMRDLPSGFLADDLAGEPAEIVRHWAVPLRDPAAWRDSLVSLLERVWSEVYAYTWRSAASAMSRELDTVARAAASSALHTVLDGAHPDLRAAPEALRVRPRPGTPAGEFDRRGMPVVVLPLAVGSGHLLRNFVDEDETLVGYTPQSVQRILAGHRPAAAGAEAELDALLGKARADMLRALRGPVTAGALAAELGYAPGVLSYHLKRLEEAGLVTRERGGQHVTVRRATRGERLVDLYS
jgi:DNA-binding transcriptional ArsR family regulator